MKEKVEKFYHELLNLFDKYNLSIDCHHDFVAILQEQDTRKTICCLHGDCEPDFDEIEEGENDRQQKID